MRFLKISEHSRRGSFENPKRNRRESLKHPKLNRIESLRDPKTKYVWRFSKISNFSGIGDKIE